MTGLLVVGDRIQPSVTVIIAAWNCAEFIHHAIDSALQQADVTLEVIVVDDASTDDTARRVSDLAELDSRLRLVSLENNAGPAKARNRGILEASHDWIAVLDADDAYRPGRLANLLTIAEQMEADIISDNFVSRNVATGRLTSPAVKKMSGTHHLDLYKFLEGARPFTNDVDLGLLKPIFSKSFLSQYEVRYPAEVRHGEDFEMILDALSKGAKYIVDPRTASYIYTDRSSGWSRTIVNYGGQIARTRFLATQAPYVSDRRLVDLLNERASALDRLENQHRELQRYRSSGSLRKLRLNLSSPMGWRRLARGMRDYIVETLGKVRRAHSSH